MNRLILFRHGKAEADSESGDDFDRRLAPRGEREAAAMGETLAQHGFVPDLALVSPAARTRGTWAAAEPALAGAEVRFDDDLYHADSASIRRIAERAGQHHATVAVVGHNPGLHELTMRLIIQGEAAPALASQAARDFPPAAAAVFRFDTPDRPVLEGLYFPERSA